MQLTLDARLVKSSGIGVYIQNVLLGSLSTDFRLKVIHKSEDKALITKLVGAIELEEYNAELYSIKELVQSPSKTLKSEIFWSPHYNVPIANFASKLKVVTIHDVFHLAYYETLSLSQKIYARLMLKKAITSDLTFTVSETSKAEIIKYTGCEASKIKVVYNGVDYQFFNKKTTFADKENILKQYSIDSPYVLFVGNVKPHKNLKNGLLGFKTFLLNNPGFSKKYKFVIVGKREGFITGDTGIDDLVSDPVLKEHVHFTNWVKTEHLPVLYQEASTFIFPSLYEGFGFPPLEAMAAGCPVISSNRSCMPEIYNDAALFFNPDNPVDIADVLNKVLINDELQQSLVAKGHKQALKYNWTEATKQKLDYIKEYAAGQ